MRNPERILTGHSARWAGGDFVGACIAEGVDVPVSAQEQLAKLLDTLCTQFDWRLDRNEPVLLNQSDQIMEAVYNTRSLALRSLVKFGFWLRRHDPEADVSEVTAILEKRFSPGTERPLSLPERAILGRDYGQIWRLDETWAAEHKSDFFPRGALPVWSEVFGSFLRFNPSSKPIFEVFRDEFDFALKHLDYLDKENLPGENPKDVLGQHLFAYYWWEVYPLRGKESLLERYYRQTDSDRVHWAAVFWPCGLVVTRQWKASR